MKTEDEWLERFGPEKPTAEGSTLYNSFGNDLALVYAADPALVWTVVDGERENDLLLHMGLFSDASESVVGYVIASVPFVPEDAHDWSRVLFVDGDEFGPIDTTAGPRVPYDPTDTEESRQWFERFGKLMSPADIMDDDSLSDDANLDPESPKDAEIIARVGPRFLWSIRDDDDGNLRLHPGYSRTSSTGVVNVVISQMPLTDAELEEGKWNDVLWYAREPVSTFNPS